MGHVTTQKDAAWWREYRQRRKAGITREQQLAQQEAEAAAARHEQLSAAHRGQPPTSTSFRVGDGVIERTGRPPNLHHGARSPERIDNLAQQKIAGLMADPTTPGYLRENQWKDAITAWARLEAAGDLLWNYLAEHDVQAALTDLTVEEEQVRVVSASKTKRVSSSRRIDSALRQWLALQSKIAEARRDLGLTPLSRARLGKDIATEQVGLAAIWAQMAKDEDTQRAVASAQPVALPAANGVPSLTHDEMAAVAPPVGEDPPGGGVGEGSPAPGSDHNR